MCRNIEVRLKQSSTVSQLNNKSFKVINEASKTPSQKENRSSYLGQTGQRCAGGTILIISLVRLALLSLDLKDELSQVLLLETGPFSKSTLMDDKKSAVTFNPGKSKA